MYTGCRGNRGKIDKRIILWEGITRIRVYDFESIICFEGNIVKSLSLCKTIEMFQISVRIGGSLLRSLQMLV